jgi:hypothetical protein
VHPPIPLKETFIENVRGDRRFKLLVDIAAYRAQTRINTNPNGTEANAAGRSSRACLKLLLD